MTDQENEVVLLVADFLGLALRRMDGGGNAEDAIEHVRALLAAWSDGRASTDRTWNQIQDAHEALRLTARLAEPGTFDSILAAH